VIGVVSLTYKALGVVLSVTVMAGDGVMVMAAVEALTVLFETEVALITTVLEGTLTGAV
jgi:hypothetical protein